MNSNQTPETVQPGDIFYNSWGYDQTNIDFIQVIEVSKTGKTVKARNMSQRDVTREHLEAIGRPDAKMFLSEYVMPNEVIGPAFRLHVRTWQWSGNDELYLRGSTFDGRYKWGPYSFSRFNGTPKLQSHTH